MSRDRDSLIVRLLRRPTGGVPTMFPAPLVGQSFFPRLLLLTCLSLSQEVYAQSIFTVAGGGSDDGRPATVAGLYNPESVAVDASGNLYVADRENHRIRKVAAGTGIISTVAGNASEGASGDGGPATAAAVGNPQDVAVDASGNLYIASSGRIRRVDAQTGIISTVAGGGQAQGDGGPATGVLLHAPEGMAVDASGNLYLAEWGNDRIRRVDGTSGIISTVAGGGLSFGDGVPATEAFLPYPSGVAVDASGNLYIGSHSREVFNNPSSTIHRVDAATKTISRVAGTGTAGFSGDGGPATAAQLDEPRRVALDASGTLYIADSHNHRLRRVDAGSGIISTVAGSGPTGFSLGAGFSGDGGPATAARLYFPAGIVVDGLGNCYISDEENHRIRKVDASSGIISTVAGSGSQGFVGDGGPATAASLHYSFGINVSPAGLAVDAAGNLHIGDIRHHRIRKVDEGNSTISTVAGDGTHGFLTVQDGGPATAAALSFPGNGVAADLSGNVYFTNGSRVLKVAAGSGIISTVAGGGSGQGPQSGVPATAVQLSPSGLTVDASGNLYIAHTQGSSPVNYYGSIRKVDLETGIITILSFTNLSQPYGIAVNASGTTIYIADYGNNRIFGLSSVGGEPFTVAGTGSYTSSGDGGPARDAGIPCPYGGAVDSFGNLYIVAADARVRKVDATTRIITTVAGGGIALGDAGPATAAGIAAPQGIAVDAIGSLYIADTGSGRIRVVFACVTLNPAELSSPADGSSGIAASPRLAWKTVPGAFRYDILLDTVNPPLKLAAADVTTPSFSPANLDPLTTYYWRIVAKGDPFCSPPRSAVSEVRSFTTAGGCRRPADPEGVLP